MEQVEHLSRLKEFKGLTQHKLINIKDSRFGMRRLYINKEERPSVNSYMNPGRGWHGYN
jgi:hypothetical protein